MACNVLTETGIVRSIFSGEYPIMRMSTYVSCITALLTLSIAPVLSNTVKYAGARQSDYGITPFPTVKEWGNVMRNMSANFSGASPVGIWIVGTLWGSSCALEFPYKGSVPNVIEKESTDKHEPFLKHFDTLGIKVFLQVEPGLAAVDSLIDIILR